MKASSVETKTSSTTVPKSPKSTKPVNLYPKPEMLWNDFFFKSTGDTPFSEAEVKCKSEFEKCLGLYQEYQLKFQTENVEWMKNNKDEVARLKRAAIMGTLTKERNAAKRKIAENQPPVNKRLQTLVEKDVKPGQQLMTKYPNYEKLGDLIPTLEKFIQAEMDLRSVLESVGAIGTQICALCQTAGTAILSCDEELKRALSSIRKS